MIIINFLERSCWENICEINFCLNVNRHSFLLDYIFVFTEGCPPETNSIFYSYLLVVVTGQFVVEVDELGHLFDFGSVYFDV